MIFPSFRLAWKYKIEIICSRSMYKLNPKKCCWTEKMGKKKNEKRQIMQNLLSIHHSHAKKTTKKHWKKNKKACARQLFSALDSVFLLCVNNHIKIWIAPSRINNKVEKATFYIHFELVILLLFFPGAVSYVITICS